MRGLFDGGVSNFKGNIVNLVMPEVLDEETLEKAKAIVSKVFSKKTEILEDKQFSKEELQKLEEHSWMKPHTMTLVEPELDEDLQREQLELLEKEILDNAMVFESEIAMRDPWKTIAIDFETHNLSRRWYNLNGRVTSDNAITGVCISAGRQEDGEGHLSWYLPLGHTESDGVLNFEEKPLMEFLERLLSKTFSIFHNATFDREVLARYGVKLEVDQYTDTMIMTNNVGVKEYYNQLGLKFLAGELLEMKMVELNELMGQKEFIETNRLPAKNIAVYGCSDAICTYELFLLFINYDELDPEEDGWENPYITQKNAMKIDMKSMDHLRSMFRSGIPLDLEYAEKQFKTLIYRKVLLEDAIAEELPGNVANTPNQVGTYIGSTLEKQFHQYYKDKYSEKKLQSHFKTAIENLFSMERKVRKLKAGDKIEYNYDVNVQTNLYDKLEDTKWVEKDVAESIAYLAGLSLDYSKVSTMLGNYKRILRHGYNDSFGYVRFSAGLRTNGASTTSRYSNEGAMAGNKGALERVEVTNGKYKPAGPVTGVNIQGISSDVPTVYNAKKITKMPEKVKQMYEESKLRMEAQFREEFLEI